MGQQSRYLNVQITFNTAFYYTSATPIKTMNYFQFRNIYGLTTNWPEPSFYFISRMTLYIPLKNQMIKYDNSLMQYGSDIHGIRY